MSLAAGQEKGKPDSSQSTPDPEPSTADRIEGWAGAHRDWADRFIGPGDAGFFPLLGFVVSGSGLSAGGGYRHDHVAGGPIGFDASGLVSYRGYQLYRIRVGLFDRQRRNTLLLRPGDGNLASQFNEGTNPVRGVGAHLDVRYSDYPRQPFYGVGSASRESDRTDYRLSGAAYEAVVQAQVTRSFGISGRAGLFGPHVSPGGDDEQTNIEGRFTEDAAPGIARQPGFVTLGLGAVLDARDRRDRPRSGSFVGVTAWRFVSRGHGGFDFTRVAFDARGYSTPVRSEDVLALRLLVSSSTPDSLSRVPFYLQHTLGGSQTLRGFHSYRFRDNFVAAATAEYRWSVHRFAEIYPFVDLGAVAPTARAMRRQDVQASYGVGAGLKWRGAVIVRADLGRSREGYHLTFGTGSLF